ncbi:hypothetical protein SAMN06298216_0698 [Spirosomataceae bacterium TFI 002]|nr:hypothetical protein SAMN06298216_0698 [Spirosomataceae bacterium TFI 002]
MNVQNIHRRKIRKPISNVLELFNTLSSKSDMIWPVENWPPMRFRNGLEIGSNGGHGPIRYEIIDYNPETHIEFKFLKPNGFNGTHKFEIFDLNFETTEIKHSITMTTSGLGTLKWLFAIRWLHDALVEDAFDKVENQLMQSNLKTKWNLWVKILRSILK